MSPASQSAAKLQGAVVLVTRPQQQAQGFIQLIEAEQGTALAFPSIELCPHELDNSLENQLNSLKQADLLIFVSANAVHYWAQLMRKLELPVDKIQAHLAVIGQATSAALSELGLKADLQPSSGFNTESLLALPQLQAQQLEQKRIYIVRGVGGLAQLGDSLQQRGARVEYVQVYFRRQPQGDSGIDRRDLSQNWEHYGISAISVTSNESLQNLYDMLEAPGRHAMLNTWLVVPSQRAGALAQSLGFKRVQVAASAMNQAMLEALEKIHKNN